VGCCYWVGSKKQPLRVEALSPELSTQKKKGLKKQKKTANLGHHCG